jgi:DNA-binding MurR/RpiR family transcriptional regulator
MDNLMESIEKLAKELGLEGFDQFTVTGAGGLMVAYGSTLHDGVFTEAIHRYTLDGHAFDPNDLNKDERRVWIKKLHACHQTQMQIAQYLDISQSLVSRELRELGLR